MGDLAAMERKVGTGYPDGPPARLQSQPWQTRIPRRPEGCVVDGCLEYMGIGMAMYGCTVEP